VISDLCALHFPLAIDRATRVPSWTTGARDVCLRMSSLLLVVVAGCGQSSQVSGLVTYDGQPLPGGRVTFLCDGEGCPVLCSNIAEDGTYVIANLPLGRVRVSIETFEPQPKPATGPDPVTGIDYSLAWEDTGRYVRIPQRYGSAKTSGIEFVVSATEQRFDIPLSP
jgi:hypothetical protein